MAFISVNVEATWVKVWQHHMSSSAWYLRNLLPQTMQPHGFTQMSPWGQVSPLSWEVVIYVLNSLVPGGGGSGIAPFLARHWGFFCAITAVVRDYSLIEFGIKTRRLWVCFAALSRLVKRCFSWSRPSPLYEERGTSVKRPKLCNHPSWSSPPERASCFYRWFA